MVLSTLSRNAAFQAIMFRMRIKAFIVWGPAHCRFGECGRTVTAEADAYTPPLLSCG